MTDLLVMLLFGAFVYYLYKNTGNLQQKASSLVQSLKKFVIFLLILGVLTFFLGEMYALYVGRYGGFYFWAPVYILFVLVLLYYYG